MSQETMKLVNQYFAHLQNYVPRASKNALYDYLCTIMGESK